MDNRFDQLPDSIKEHLKAITESSGLPDNEESLKMISDNWFEKKELFEDQVKALDMIEFDSFSKDEKKAALMLTYSGSLISLGSIKNGSRWVEYSSIKLRNDVPDILIEEKASLSKDTGVDQALEFEEGPIKNTSALLKIVVCSDDVSLDEQDNRIREATIFLTNGFIKINRTLSIHRDSDMGFTTKAIINHVAKRNNLTLNQAKRIIDDYTCILESGVLLGEKVPVGRLGRMYLKLKPAQKARVGRNPATGEEITIKAKPEMLVPKINFSKYLKEKASIARIDPEMSEDISEEGSDSDE
ncbi:MAG: HU family DNA-binding protein [Spirochaetes bacterium]|nr:HU family DNA-binding protein [Spirochaetota bacterium]